MLNFSRAAVVAAALLCAYVAPAAEKSATESVSYTLLRSGASLGAHPSKASCEIARDAQRQIDAPTKTAGQVRFVCREDDAVTVIYGPTPTCPPLPAPQGRVVDCPTGYTGAYTQTRSYSAAPHPTCAVIGSWVPTSPPAGICVPTDTDGDGVPDSADECPTVHAATPNGCPATPPDADGDGVPDTTDLCPSVPASTDDGCPVIEPNPTAFTKWVTPTGSSSSACSQSAPCSLQRALATVRAGDTVKVEPGLYTAACSGSRYTPTFQPANSGTSATQQITLVGGGGTTTELRCASGAGPVIGTYQRRWVTWDGFFIDESRSPSVSDTGPAVVWASEWVTLRNLVIAGAPIAREDNHTGIRVEQSRDITLDGNTITGIRHTRSPSQNFAGIMGYDAIRVTVTDNVISDSDVGIFPKGDHSLSGYGLGEWRITGNRITARRTGMQIGGLKSGSNYGRSVISENVITGTGEGGVVLVAYDGVSPRAIDFVRNTVTGFGAAIIATGPGGNQSQVDIAIRDNVLVGTTVAVNVHWTGSRSTFASDYNLLWPASVGSRGGWFTDGNTRDSLAQWRSATGNDAHSIAVNPSLSSDFKLPANHAGRTAGSSGGLVGVP